MRLWILSMAVLVFLFCTVRLPAQTAGGTSQVSPVANLQGSNASVVNNNFQYLQNGVNAALYLIQQYFPGGILQTNMGGTGLNLSTSAAATGDTLMTSGTGTISLLTPGTAGYYLQSQGAGTYPQYVAIQVPHNVIGTWNDSTGVVCNNNSGLLTNYVVIDSGTDWAGKNIMLIGNVEVNTSASWTTTPPSIVNTSTTALSGMQYSNNLYNFNLKQLTLPSINNYTTLLNNGHAPGNGTNTASAVAIGVNGSGNLSLVSVCQSYSGVGNTSAFAQISGAILRTP